MREVKKGMSLFIVLLMVLWAMKTLASERQMYMRAYEHMTRQIAHASIAVETEE